MVGVHHLHAVTNHAFEYIRTWCLPVSLYLSEIPAARLLLAAGRGPARVTTCQHVLEGVRALARNRRLVARAMSLLNPSELAALRVTEAMVLDIVLEALQRIERDAPPTTLRVLDSIQSLGWCERGNGTKGSLALLKWCAGTLKQLDCPQGHNYDDWNGVLARCTRLECLTSAFAFPSAAWLGLSQLHTLLDVDLAVVSAGVIAAALPRLHTLGFSTPYRSVVTAAAVAGFFDTLLPRLRAFRFYGSAWPKKADTAPTPTPPRGFPLLEEFIWKSDEIVDGFADAQPIVFCAPQCLITQYLTPSRDAGCEPFSRVRSLRFVQIKLPKATDVAALLRAAPELRRLEGGMVFGRLDWREDPAFAGLVHRNLRSLRFASCVGTRTDKELFFAEFDGLRAQHFPRLRTLALERDFL
jgi:hypothetical protein